MSHGFSIIVSVLFFFFKQKTAYEMRISDWSSDVCSSDLSSARGLGPYGPDRAGIEREPVRPKPACAGGCHGGAGRSAPLSRSARRRPQARAGREAWGDRKSVG